MASTQSAPNLAPPNGANPGQGQGVNPLQNLTGDQVKDILQKLRQMKASMDAKGIRVEDLPSDKKERYKYFLSVYVQVMAYQQKKNAAANGAQGQNPSAPSASGANQGQPQNTGQKAPTVSGGPWSKAQYDLYRHQQMLHEKAKNNQPLTAADIQSLQEYTSVVAPSRVKAVKEAEKVVENAEKGSIEPATSNGDAVPKQDWYKNMELPSVLSGQINYQKYRIRKNRPSVPGSWPYGLDTQEIRARRQEVVIHAMARRRDELAQQSASIGVWDTGKTDAPTRDDSLKIQVYNELAALDKYAKQQQLRDAISREMFHYSQGMTANRSIHRRLKKPTLREARVTESLEKQQREARDTREKKKQYDQLQAILQHGQELVNASTQNRARSQKLGRMMVSHHQYMEKEEQRRVERTAKQRLQALKANDEETYMKLLGQAKDSRISHLLNQTDKFLKELAASVRRQQRNQAERYGEDDEEEEEEEEELADSDIDESTQDPNKKKIDYYAVAHRIREQVTEQPSILVGGSLKEYQLKGLQWMISLYNNNLNGILADEMGLGKTIQTISLITHIIEKKRNNGPFLVIVPLSTLTNWNIEFDKWAPSVTKVVYKGPPNARKQQQQQIRWGNFQVLLTTYEYIIKDRPILSKIKWTHMIVDEGHRMKNANSKLSSTLSSYYNSRYRLILTGTPLQNNLPELWALLNFVLPNIFKSVKSFDEWFNTPFANTGGQDRMDLSEEEQLLVIRRLHKVLRPFLLRRLKKDVEKDLPDKQERVIKCRFSALQAKLYKQLVTHNKIAVGDGKGGKTGMRGLSNMLMQLRKLCNHPFVFEPVEDQMNPTRMTNDLLWRTAGKFELLDRILPKFRATGHRVLMFFQMTQIMNIMEDFLRMRGLKYLRLDGSTKSDDRSDLLKVFNDPNSEYFCFLLSTRAGGLGLNLQTADTVIIYDSDWNPHQDLQAQDRAHRIGQKNEVRILRLISSNSVEEKILERAQFKLDMDGKVIQAGKFDNKSTNEERDALLRTLLDTAEAADQVGEQEEMDDDDLNEIMSRSEEEVKIFQEMDKQRALTGTYGPGKRYPRLMCEEELPDIYLQEDNPITEDVEAEVYGRGARERKVTRYDDGLSEQQFLDAMEGLEEGRLTLDQVIERNERRAAERAARKDKKHKRAAGLPDSSPEPSVVDEESETPQKKQGRRRGPPPKRKAEEPPIEENPQPKRKRGRQPKIPETLSSADRATLTRIVTSTIQTLKEMEQEIPTEGSDSEEEPLVRAIIDPFMKPPPRSQYPDYYMIIKNPIAMEQIEKKLKRDDYQSLKEFRDDVHLLCQNARTYNEDGSILFQDANDIEAKCVMELKKQSEGYPEFSNFDDPGSIAGDGVSTGGASGTDTPLTAGTPGAQPKLKLTFNNSNFDSGSTANGTEPSLDEE